MREDVLQTHLQGFNTTDTCNINTVHSSSTADETTFIIICTVNTQTHYCWIVLHAEVESNELHLLALL